MNLGASGASNSNPVSTGAKGSINLDKMTVKSDSLTSSSALTEAFTNLKTFFNTELIREINLNHVDFNLENLPIISKDVNELHNENSIFSGRESSVNLPELNDINDVGIEHIEFFEKQKVNEFLKGDCCGIIYKIADDGSLEGEIGGPINSASLDKNGMILNLDKGEFALPPHLKGRVSVDQLRNMSFKFGADATHGIREKFESLDLTKAKFLLTDEKIWNQIKNKIQDLEKTGEDNSGSNNNNEIKESVRRTDTAHSIQTKKEIEPRKQKQKQTHLKDESKDLRNIDLRESDKDIKAVREKREKANQDFRAEILNDKIMNEEDKENAKNDAIEFQRKLDEVKAEKIKESEANQTPRY